MDQTRMTMTSMTSDAGEPTPQAVLAFLQRHPDFLQKHPELISTLPEDVRGAGENIVDFQQMMVQRLRQDKQRAEDRQRLLVDSARNNMTIQARVHAGILRLLEATSLDEMVEIITSELSLMLEVDSITVLIESPVANDRPSNFHGLRMVDHGFVDDHLGADRDSLLQANVTGDPRLFGPAARLVKSHALLRLNIDSSVPDGLLAFGSRDPLLFTDGQGTELVGFLTDVIERLLRHYLCTMPVR